MDQIKKLQNEMLQLVRLGIDFKTFKINLIRKINILGLLNKLGISGIEMKETNENIEETKNSNPTPVIENKGMRGDHIMMGLS